MKRKLPAAGPKAIELPPRLIIAQSAELHRTLIACCEREGPLLLDGSRVEEIDTAILQLLVSAWMGGARRGVECRWLGASQALREAAALIGVAATLQLDCVVAPGAAHAAA